MKKVMNFFKFSLIAVFVMIAFPLSSIIIDDMRVITEDTIEKYRYIANLENPDEPFECDVCHRKGKLRDFPKHSTETSFGTICGYCVD